MKLKQLHAINEDSIASIFYRFLDMVRGKAGFGPGVSPRNWGDVEEIIEANGLPAIDFQEEWQKATREEDSNKQKALQIYKRLADKHPISGLRSKSYFTR